MIPIPFFFNFSMILNRSSVSSIDKDTAYIAEKLGVSYQEIMSYMVLDKKTYKDYKSQQSIYNVGTSISRLLGIEKGGKR